MEKTEVIKNTNPRLIWLPLELLDKRYTKQTRDWYQREFKNQFDLIKVEGDTLTSKIESGSFLDAYGTNYYKYTQLAKVSKMFRDNKIKNNDTFFIDDLWFPGIEGLRYMEKMGKELNINIFGVMHAGSWTPSDDVATKLGTKDWCEQYEKSLFSLCDGVFVGSNFHKAVIDDKFNTTNVHNTGLPFYPSDVLKQVTIKPWNKRTDVVVFPHRIHPEKHPELFEQLKQKYPQWEFIRSMDYNFTKKEFYELLANSKVVVSFADQENFGFSTLEAATLGCALVLPNKVVYPEFYPKECLYNNTHECEKLVSDIMETQFYPPSINKTMVIPYKFEKSIKKMCEVIKSGMV